MKPKWRSIYWHTIYCIYTHAQVSHSGERHSTSVKSFQQLR